MSSNLVKFSETQTETQRRREERGEEERRREETRGETRRGEERRGVEWRDKERRREERSREDGGMIFWFYGFLDEVSSAPGFLNSGPDWSLV